LGSLQTKLRIFGAEVLNFCFKPHTPSIPYLWPRAILNTFLAPTSCIFRTSVL